METLQCRVLSEADETTSGPNELTIKLGTPSNGIGILAQSVALKEPDNILGDFIGVATVSGGMVVGLCEPEPLCVNLLTRLPSRIPETGEPQDVADFTAPDGTHVHVIVQSAVPEPKTALLLTAGIGSLSVVRRRMRAAT